MFLSLAAECSYAIFDILEQTSSFQERLCSGWLHMHTSEQVSTRRLAGRSQTDQLIDITFKGGRNSRKTYMFPLASPPPHMKLTASACGCHSRTDSALQIFFIIISSSISIIITESAVLRPVVLCFHAP